MEETTYAPTYKVADAFCGCGGLSLSFAMTRRFEVILGIDIKPEALETFGTNHALVNGKKPITLNQNIEEVDSNAFVEAAQRYGVGEIDCLIGGPPCEGFSQNRTSTENGSRTHKFIDDPRNHLFRWFVDLAAKLQPKVVLIENVPDLVRHRDGATRNEILAALEAAGYVATVRVLNAADYGVPQIRSRAFFLAQRKSDFVKHGVKMVFPATTHKPYPMRHKSLMYEPNWFPGDLGYWVTVREAIGDLPPTSLDSNEATNASYPKSIMTSFRSLMRSKDDYPHNHIARKLGKGGLVRLQALRPGQTCADLPDHLCPKGHYHYSYTRMIWSEPVRTITKFLYHVGSGQFGHPEEDRAITIREAARLQSFPDDFRFVGTKEIRKLSALVGSAVFPLLARAIARQIGQYLDQLHLLNMDPKARLEAKLLAGDAVMRRLEFR